ncbi:hypothetical protein [Streptomyces sp. CH6]|uniref:hypothetical protein n=1 Tax=unclassified Streptomyces TaxID=2593676 RepID=UPI003CFDF8F0
MIRQAPVTATVLLLVGLSAGTLGLLGANADLWRVGLFLTLTAVPLLITGTLRRVLHTSEQAISDADRAGYVRALDHVARGLLDPPAPPRPGNHADDPEQSAGVVIPLRPYDRRTERKAQ